MNIAYIANARIPTEKAHGVHIMEMCHAFAARGATVTLYVPKRNNPIAQDAFAYYNIEKNFTIQYVEVADTVEDGFIGYWRMQLAFARRMATILAGSDATLFTRDEFTGAHLAKKGHTVFYDMHGFPEHWKFVWKRWMRVMQGIVCTNEWKMQQCMKQFGIPLECMVVARNGYNAALFAKAQPAALHAELNIEANVPLVLYTGHLYPWKGAHILLEAAAKMPEAHIVFVGGSQKSISTFREGKHVAQNVTFLGQRPHADIPGYLAAADVLVVPNAIDIDNKRLSVYSKYDTSPIKVFEYMASGKPIVASDLPSIREVLSNKNALLCESDNADALVQKIQQVIAAPNKAAERAQQAVVDAKAYTWDNRAQIIINFLKKITS